MLEIRKQRFGKQRTIHERHQRRTTARWVVTAAVVLCLLLVGAAVVYVWYMGRHPIQQTAQQVEVTPTAPQIKAYTPAADAPVSIVQESFSGPASPGTNASLGIKTNPGAACQISVKVNDQSLPDTGLVPKIADEFGLINWSWTVPKNVLPGKWPVEVTCANAAKKSAYYKVELEVTR